MDEVAGLAMRRGDTEAAAATHTWWPGLEGLRGLGLIVVLISHQQGTIFLGGYLSVSMFFTLSGFLITTLLLREWERSGRIDLRRFWSRRVRRLLAMAMAGLLLAVAVARATRGEALLPPIASDIRWAALNLANWRFINTDTSYQAVMSMPSPVTHYWSLAIEEQYYLLYPVIAAVALRWGRRSLGMALGVMTIGSLVAQLIVGGGDRAYFGTDTRLAELAIGGLLAVLWTEEVRLAIRLRYIDAVAVVAGIGVALLWWRLPLDSPRLWHGGMLLHSILVGLLVIGATEEGLVARLTSYRPIVWLGGLSYACYIVHFPLYQLLDEERTGLSGVALFAVRVAASLGLATALRQLIERPVRFSGAFKAARWQGPVAALSAIGVVLVMGTALPHVGRANTALEEAFTNDGGISVRSPVPDVVQLPTTSSIPSDGTTSSTVATGSSVPGSTATTKAGPAATTPPGGATTATTEKPRALKLLMAGDSTAGVWADGMQQWASDKGYASVDRTGGPGCVLHQEGLAYMRPGWLYQPNPGCLLLGDLIVQDARKDNADAVVLMIGTIQLADWVIADGAPHTSLLDASYANRYRATFDAVLDQLSTQLNVPIFVATVPGPRWVPVDAKGTGDLTVNSIVRSRRLNQINASVVAEHPRARMVDFASYVSDPDGWVDMSLHPDGVHIDPRKVPGVLDRGLMDQLRAAYRSVVTAVPSVRKPGATIWWP
jgi:peptidoglycan/LPS O-acetylase OafA/YrhL